MFPDDVVIEKYKKFTDSRGELVITHEGLINDVMTIKRSFSKKNVLRGLHFQKPPNPQRKIIEVVSGSIIGLLINMDNSSIEYGKFHTLKIDSADGNLLQIPSHYAHGFIALTDVVFQYFTIGPYSAESEIAITPPKFFYEQQGFDVESLIISDKDRLALCYEEYFQQ